MRVYDHTIPERRDRYCEACYLQTRDNLNGGTKFIEDERHLIFECVLYKRLRSSLKWGPLYAVNTTGGEKEKGKMRSFMNQEDQGKLAHLIHLMLEIRKGQGLFLNQDVDLFSSPVSSPRANGREDDGDLE